MLCPLNFNKHAKDVMDFCHDNRFFFIDYENSVPDELMVEKLFTHVPNGVSLEQKQVLGIYHSGKLNTLLELIINRHKKHEWLLSLFIVDRDNRQKGLGTKAIIELERHLAKLGVTCILLGVIESNLIAMSFWKSLNYRKPQSHLFHKILVERYKTFILFTKKFKPVNKACLQNTLIKNLLKIEFVLIGAVFGDKWHKHLIFLLLCIRLF